jgi:Orsellinic acid/F9775 biosynthesis cluster protein D
MSEQYIKYEPQLRVMICRLCKEGVGKNTVARHYREYHKNLPNGVRKGMVAYSNNFELCETNEIQYPNTIIPRIEELAVTMGLRCLYDGCNYACIAMTDHCRPCHGWVASKGMMLRYIFFNVLCRSYVDGV